MYYMWINKNLVHQVGDQTNVILRCTVNQPSRFAMLNKQDRYTNARRSKQHWRSLINVLYVNRQEFSASSWRSNQCYTKMHGQPTIKICNAKQARQIYQYKKIKTTLKEFNP